jgi:cytochrome P450
LGTVDDEAGGEDEAVDLGERFRLVEGCRDRQDADGRDPAGPAVSQLVFGAGAHACPGARLAREQLSGLLAALAPARPVVVRARADRGAALPGWRTLVIRSGERPC